MTDQEKGPDTAAGSIEAPVKEGEVIGNVPGTDVSDNSERTALKADPDESLGFLLKWSPEGPWALTCIQTDRKAIETRTFYPKDEAALLQWLTQYNGVRNIYFHVNPVIRDVKKKAEREDIKELAWLHVDVDPRAGEDIGEERARALKLFTSNLPKGVPAPTCIIFSGGGYQAFWKLRTPLPVDGDLAKAEDVKRYNQQLERLFSADNCHNIDRIMRLPGTLNIPNANKLKKGRVVELAKVVDFNENIYDISQFTPAPASPNSDSVRHAVEIDTGSIERVADVNALVEYGVPDRVKVAIVQGKHPDQPLKGDNSRSAWLFFVCCNLVRCGVPDEMIYAIITDKEFGISESVLELGSRAESYALRQIERAHEGVDDPWLRKLNDKHAVIGNLGGKCRVIEEVYEPLLKRHALTRQSFDDFRNRYRNKKVQIGTTKEGNPVMMAVGNWWIDHPKRRQYETLVFAPNKHVEDAYNLWTGYGCEPAPGDCSLFLDHVRRNICRNNEEHFQYLIAWMARAVQEPASPGEVAVVLRGGKGNGKGFFAREFGSLFGRHFLHIANSSHLVGNFNSHLQDCVVLFADESFALSDKKHVGVLNMLITEPTIPIEKKGIDVVTSPNCVHLIMSSNEKHVIPASCDERRFFVLDVGDENKRDTEFFRAVDAQLKSGGREALLHFLKNLDVSEFEVRNVPQTEALRDQKVASLKSGDEFILTILEEGFVGADRFFRGPPDAFVNNGKAAPGSPPRGLYDLMRARVPRLRDQSDRALAGVIEPWAIRRYRSSDCRGWELMPLAEMRAAWDAKYGPHDWPDDAEHWADRGAGRSAGGDDETPF